VAAEGRLRAGILGCGRVAGAFAEPGGRVTTHAQGLAGAQAFRLVAIGDADQSRAQAFAARWHVDDICTLEELGAAGLDLLVVATPDRVHAANLASLLAGARPPRLVVMEKPLCVSPDELAELEPMLMDRSQSTVVVNHPRRFARGHQEVRDLIAGRQLGTVIGAHWVYYGGWLHNGVHVIDTLRMLLGDEIEVAAVRAGAEVAPVIQASTAISAAPPGRRRGS
jgi:predicted dehydrogenase